MIGSDVGSEPDRLTQGEHGFLVQPEIVLHRAETRVCVGVTRIEPRRLREGFHGFHVLTGFFARDTEIVVR